MSFLSVLRTIGRDLLAVDRMAAPVVSIFNPAIGGLMTGLAGRIPDLVVNTEQIITGAKQGAIKSENVINDFNLITAELQELLAPTKQLFTYDADKLQAAINAAVASFNAMAELKTSFKVVPKS